MVDTNSINIEYPALYIAADNKSTQSQKIYLRITFILLSLLVLSSLSSLFSGRYQICAVVSLVFLAVTPMLSLVLLAKRYDKIWYSGRSLAESIKTMSWRFMMRSQPYDKDDNTSRRFFINELKEIFDNNREFCHHLSDTSPDKDELPVHLENIRKYSLGDRISIYTVHRIDEQKSWYWKKGVYNNKMASQWFWFMITLQILAIVSAAIKIAHVEWVYLPTSVFTAFVAAVVGWIQVKRFQELGTSYTLATREIGMVRMSLSDSLDEKQFSDFVGDAENAFSREHTQWFARKDT